MPNRLKVPVWALNVKVWIAVIVGVPAVYAAAATMGVDLPRPAFWAAHQADVVKITTKHDQDMRKHDQDMSFVGKELKETLTLVAVNACAIVEADRKRIRSDYFATKDRAEPYREKRKPVPQWIKERERVIEERQRENERQRTVKRCP